MTFHLFKKNSEFPSGATKKMGDGKVLRSTKEFKVALPYYLTSADYIRGNHDDCGYAARCSRQSHGKHGR